MEDDDGDARHAGVLPGRPRLAPLTGPPSLSPFLKREREGGAALGNSSSGRTGNGGGNAGVAGGSGDGSGGAFGSPVRSRSASGRRERRKWTREEEDTLRIAYQT